MYSINKSLSAYIEMHKEIYVGEEKAHEDGSQAVKRDRVDIHKVCAEIDESLSRLDRFVKADLEKIAMLDGKLHQ